MFACRNHRELHRHSISLFFSRENILLGDTSQGQMSTLTCCFHLPHNLLPPRRVPGHFYSQVTLPFPQKWVRMEGISSVHLHPERSPAFAARGHGGVWECRRGWDTNHQSQRKKNLTLTHSQKRENTVGPNPPAVGLSFCISQVCVCGWGWLITLGRLILNPYAWRRAPGQ